jgi:titin
MSLIDIVLQRRRAKTAREYRPTAEVLEERQCPAVAAPTGFHLTALSISQVKLTWNDVAGELGFNIYQWNGTKSVLVASPAKGVTSFTIGALQPNTTYYFSVAAFDRATIAATPWEAVTTPPNAITAPTNLHVGNVTSTSVSLAWNLVPSASSYSIYGWNGSHAFLIGSTPGNVPSFIVKNLTPGVTYYFYVQSVNPTNSANSSWVSATTTSPGITAPPLTAQVLGPSTIALSWKDVNNETGFKIYEWNGNSALSPVLIATLPAQTTGYQVTGLLPGTTYWFYVQAFNATNFANSAWVSAATPAALPLQAPTQVLVTQTGPNSVNVKWNAVARAAGYRIGHWNGTSWDLVATVTAGTLTAPVTGLAAGQTHWFIVEAFTDNFGEVAYSNPVFINL